MAIYFTADTHFGHVGIFRNFCKQRSKTFKSLDAMDAALLANLAAALRSPEDELYHLGDVVFGGVEEVKRIADRIGKMPGRKFLIPGNHDDEKKLAILRSAFTILPPLWETDKRVGKESMHLVLCHYPLLTWNEVYGGALHFHGHVHGRIDPDKRRIDVGVDVPDWGFAPARLEYIVQRMKIARDWVNPEPDRLRDED